MSVRNIRNHHTRGLLPPPEVRARVGYYNAEHVARLRLILDLQADGFNLAAIERLLSGSDGLAQRLLGLRKRRDRTLRARDPRDHHRQGTHRAVRRDRRKDIARVRRLKLLIPLGDDRFEVPSPALLGAAEQVMALGISLHAALGARRTGQPQLRIDLASLHKALPQRALGALRTRGQPDERWEELTDAVNSLRPLASEALLALFKQRMTTQLEDTFGKMIEHQARRR